MRLVTELIGGMMATEHSPRDEPGAFEHLVDSLGEHAREFTPAERREGSRAEALPGRRASQSDAPGPRTGSPASAVVLDCGTSRLSGYSHVLLISPSVESIVGSHRLDQMGAAIRRLPGVIAYEWEGLDRIHLRAPGSDWGQILEAARAAVDRVIAG